MDPANASTIVYNDDNNSILIYNVTHWYTRRRAQSLGWYLANRRCVVSRSAPIPYWIDEYSMPDTLWRCDVDRCYPVRDVHASIREITSHVLSELQLPFVEINLTAYYQHLAAPVHFIPLHVHFRSLPYPQSTFTELVTDRDRAWVLYSADAYGPSVAGTEVDLLYRLRHNVRHSFGLGHAQSTASIMHPTNVPGLDRVSAADHSILHRLLCDYSISRAK